MKYNNLLYLEVSYNPSVIDIFTNLVTLLLLFSFKGSISVFPMLAVKALAVHNIKGYSCKLYFFTSDFFGLLPVKSVVPFPVIYRQPTTITLKDLLVTHSLSCGNILLKEMISFILNARILIYKKR